MKKITALFFLLFTVSFAREITLNEMISQFKKNGRQKKYNEIETEKRAIEREKTKKMYRDGIGVSVTPSHEFLYDPTKKDWDTSTAKVSYDFLSAGVYDMKDGADTWVGVDKNLKDLIYSEKKHRLNILEFTEVQTDITNQKNMNNEVIKLIDLYKKYLNLDEYINFMESQHEQYVSEYDIIKKGFNLGSQSKLDEQLAEVKLENLEAEMIYTKDELAKIKNDFLLLFNIEIDKSSELKPFDIEKYDVHNKINKIGKTDIEKSKLDSKIEEEQVSFSKYDNDMPDLNFSTKYMIQKEDWVISLEINKKFFSFDDLTKTNQLNLKKADLEAIYTKDRVTSLRRENSNLLKNLSTDLNSKERLAKVKKLETDIFNEMYKNGSKSFSDYIDKRREYEQAYLELVKAENELKSFLYKLDYKI